MVALICIYGLSYEKKDIEFSAEREIEFNQAQKQYLQQRDEITVYIDPALRHLINEDGGGFLQECLNGIFKPMGVELVMTEEKIADCRLMVVTEDVRENHAYSYTSPVFQIDGAFFLSEKADGKPLSGVIMSSRVSDDKLENVTYHDNSLEFLYAHNAEEAVEIAYRDDKDFIVGDRSAILSILGETSDYLATEDVIYSMNVCIITAEENTELYGVLSKCINNADRHGITYKAGQKWMDGNGPVYMKDRYEDIYLLILIIFAAVLIAFFIYYQANKNLYHELNERMNLLTDSKRELKTTFNSVGYYLAELDLDGSITDINRAFYSFVETDTANEKIWDVFDMQQHHKNRLETSVLEAARGQHVDGIEIILNNRTLVMDIFPIENTRGTVEKLLFMGMDVTNERMAERQLLQDNKMIAVGQLAAGVAHEIRNPLGIIRNYCYVLKNMNDEENKAKAIEQIEKAVDNSGDIINSLLNFSRIPTHRSEMVNIEEHIKSLTVLNKNILNKKNINLHITCPEPVSAYLPVQSLDMILINLISNATDAMTENGDLTINVIKYAKRFEIEVRDTGTGIDENVLEEIFNPFFTTKGSSGGTGLGLYIVYNEVQKINGEITVESTLGRGACFKITLPLNNAFDNKEKKHE